MASITALACIAVAVGLVASAMAGRSSRGSDGCLLVIAFAFGSVFLGAVLFFGASLSYVFCERTLKLCEPTSDTDIWSVSYPLLAIPLFWVTMLVAKSVGKAETSEVLAENALPDTDAIFQALSSYRSGSPVDTRCRTCGGTLTVKPVKRKPDNGAGALRVTCECGQSNGTYRFTAKNA